MGDYTEPVSNEGRSAGDLSHRRILMIMAVAVVGAGVLGFVFGSSSFGAGVLIGGSLSFVNYFWLKGSLRSLFDRTAVGGSAGFLAAKYFFRYLVIALVLALFYYAFGVPATAMLLGLASFAIAVVIEGVLRIFTTSY
ncbi:MAG TPA: ATP synthase subunit I [Pyrinomonadaceae bacterium]|nr:ATP synthase subunit I [Pyrinomonadaceae bacterium]